MTGYNFHPEAAADLEDIWEFIANDNFSDYENVNLDAADRVIGEILAVLDRLAPFPNRGHKTPRSHCAAAAVHLGR
jgi:plasmid stabilization system protein ParE